MAHDFWLSLTGCVMDATMSVIPSQELYNRRIYADIQGRLWRRCKNRLDRKLNVERSEH